MKKILEKLINFQNLSSEEMSLSMKLIMEGKASPAQIASFLTALRMKGETIEEIASAARVMREKSLNIKVDLTPETPLIDTCGTGGDNKKTFNISTASAFVVAGTNLKVAKHGNRSISSQSGSADVLESLGIKIDLSPKSVVRCIQEVGIGFLFAPSLHPAMKYAISPRRELGFRTIFNILGPLTNPAGANIQVLGVFDKKLLSTLVRVLKELGSLAAMVVYGEGGYDEITITGKTYVSELKNGCIREYILDPKDFGLSYGYPEDLEVNSPQESALIIEKILSGKEKGPRRDMVVLNAAAAIYLSKNKDFKHSLEEAIQSIDRGKAWKKLQELREFSRHLT